MVSAGVVYSAGGLDEITTGVVELKLVLVGILIKFGEDETYMTGTGV